MKEVNGLSVPSANFWVGCVIVESCLQSHLQLSGVCQASSEFHANKNHTNIFDINLLLASAIVVSGNSFTKVKMLISKTMSLQLPYSEYFL